LDNVIGFIQDKCPEIDKFFYPYIKKEYETRTGSRTKDMPLYEGYLFLRYHNHPDVFHKLSNCPQVTTYCGVVNNSEIAEMQAAQGKLYADLKTSRFSPGDIVVFKEGPFKGWEARVVSVTRGTVRALIEASILGSTNHEVVYPEDQLERKPELQNSVVQDI
jgi:transcription antitermination factor NusG